MLLLSEREARLLWCLNGRLVPGRRTRTDVAGVLREVCGVQAQLPRAAALALRARTDGMTLPDAVRAREGERSAVRGWFMRGTLYLVAAEDAGWLLAVLGPVFVARGRRRLAQLGLDEDATRKGVREVRAALAEEGPMRRADILDRLRRRGAAPGPDDRAGYASTYLLRRAALEGAVCFGPDRDGEETYVLSHDWGVPKYRGTRQEALAELARRHLAAHGPAVPGDLAAWSGLPVRQARAAWRLVEKDLQELRVDGRQAWVLSGCTPEPPNDVSVPVRLLPHFDPYLLGHGDRGLVVPPPYAGRVQRSGGFVRPVATENGVAFAIWEYRGGRQPEVDVELFEARTPDAAMVLGPEVEDVGRFLGARPAPLLRVR